jgi:hypothetical protein
VDRVCISCTVSRARAFALISVVALVCLLSAVVHFRFQGSPSFQEWVEGLWLVGVVKQVDGGALRVAWSNYQVLATIFPFFERTLTRVAEPLL